MSSHAPELIDGPELLKQAERAALEKRLAILRAMSPEDRLRIGAELYELGIDLIAGSYRSAHPGATDEEVQAELRRRLLPAGLCKEFEAYLQERLR